MTAVTATPTHRRDRHDPRGAAAAGAVSRHSRAGGDAALRQQRLLGADRHPRGDLLGAGVRPQSGGRLRRPSRDRLCRAADARRLHHQRAGRRQCDAAGAGIRGVADRGHRRRCLRRHRRAAGAAIAHLLFRDVDARLRHHRHPDRAGLAERHRRRHRHRPVRNFPRTVQYRLGLLLPLYRLCRLHHLDERQCRAQPVRPRPDRGARCRGRRRSHRHFQAENADRDLPARRRAGGDRRRTVREPADLHHAGRLHLRSVGAVLHRDPDRRPRFDPGADARHHHPDDPAGDRSTPGGVVDVPLRGAAAGDRAGDARRHRRTARFPQPPPARQQPRHRAAARGARRYRAQAAPAARALSAARHCAQLRQCARHRRPRSRCRARPDPRPDRPQWQRQDHDAQRDLRLLRRQGRNDDAGRRRAAAGHAGAARPQRHRAHLPDPARDRRGLGAAERDDRRHHRGQGELRRGAAVAAAQPPGRAHAHRQGARRCSASSDSRRWRMFAPTGCSTANCASSRSRAR